jgi:uncharacterized protein (TIGR00730 family)
MSEMRTLCVYCGASQAVDGVYLEAARELGSLAAERGVRVVFGGGRVGLMGALADGALAAGGEVTGVIPEHLMGPERAHGGVQELLVVESMHSRKARMAELSDAFCILPGGLGTLDETFEIITWKILALHDKPVVIVNLGGYWDPLLALLEHQGAQGFLHGELTSLLAVVERVDQVFGAVARAPRPQHPIDARRF